MLWQFTRRILLWVMFHLISLPAHLSFNKGFAEVTGETVNRGAGYRLEIPSVYRLYDPKVYVDKLKKLVNSLKETGLVVIVVKYLWCTYSTYDCTVVAVS